MHAAIFIAHGGKKTSFLNDFVWTKEEERKKQKKKKNFLVTIRSREHRQRTVFGYVDAVSAAEFRCHEDQRHPGWEKNEREGGPSLRPRY